MSQAIRRTQQERRADSERKLLDATAALIVERGYGQLSSTALNAKYTMREHHS
jgi:AcrR family transcriptional regulator